ncbi:MAG: DUF2057 domain-containing protein, partial [Gammaproteobacteria bacterium]|nr:DUF2057 domain-containing protein [Gammaproteobacteria bacterium]
CAGKGNVIQTPGTSSLADDAVARVEIPYALTLLAVDGEQVAAPRSDSSSRARLMPGTRRLRFAYEKNWGNPDTYDWVYSAHVVEIELRARPGVLYRAGYPEPANRHEAVKLAVDLRMWVDSPDGTRVASRTGAPHGSPLTRLIRSNSGAATSYTAAASAPAAASGTGDSVDQAEALLSDQDALQRLKLWWKLASDEQRKAFQQWIKTQ